MSNRICVSIDIFCELCGKPLESESGEDFIHVRPCEHCMDNKYNDGYSVGYKLGLKIREK